MTAPHAGEGMMQRTVIHVVQVPGMLSEPWLAQQLESGTAFTPRFWAMSRGSDPYHWRIRPDTVMRKRWWTMRAARRLEVLGGHSVAAAINRGVALTIRERPELFHAHFGTFAAGWAKVAASTAVPLAVSFYGQDASLRRFRNEPWLGWYQRLFAVCSLALVEGPAMRRRLLDLGCPESKLAIVRLPLGTAMDVDRDGLRRMALTAATAEYAAFIGGRFVEKKGFEVAIRGFAHAFPDGKERLLIVGDGPLRSKILRLIDDLGMVNRTTVLKPVPIDRFVATMRKAAAVLFPSVTAEDGDGEGGAPMALPLAQSAGLRVIVSDHDDLPFASAPGTPVVPSGDADALADTLRTVVGEVRQTSARHVEQVLRAGDFVAREHEPSHLLALREAAYLRALR